MRDQRSVDFARSLLAALVEFGVRDIPSDGAVLAMLVRSVVEKADESDSVYRLIKKEDVSINSGLSGPRVFGYDDSLSFMHSCGWIGWDSGSGFRSGRIHMTGRSAVEILRDLEPETAEGYRALARRYADALGAEPEISQVEAREWKRRALKAETEVSRLKAELEAARGGS